MSPNGANSASVGSAVTMGVRRNSLHIAAASVNSPTGAP